MRTSRVSAGGWGVRRLTLQARDRLRHVGRLAKQVDRPLEQVGLDFDHARRLLQCARRLAQGLGLPSQRGTALLEEIEDRVERCEGPRDEFALRALLAVEQFLHQLQLALRRGEDVPRQLSLPGRRTRPSRPPTAWRPASHARGCLRRVRTSKSPFLSALGSRRWFRGNCDGGHGGSLLCPATSRIGAIPPSLP